jgi:AcrR family transcriptional regulator
MGSKERRVREREDTRSRILDAARDMFVDNGVEAVTMRAIAQRIEYTPTAIYHHFRDKQALIEELCLLDFGSLASAFHRIGKIEDPVERLRRIGLAYVDFALAYPSHYQFMFLTPKPVSERSLAHDRGRPPDEDAYLVVLETVTEGIHANRFRPELDDPHELAQVCWAAMHGIAALHVVKFKEKKSSIEWRDPRESARTMVDVLMRGIRRDPS